MCVTFLHYISDMKIKSTGIKLRPSERKQYENMHI